MSRNNKFADELVATASKIATSGRGILAADEDAEFLGKQRFEPLRIANTRDNRREYRRLLFTTRDFSTRVSGVIIVDETLSEKYEDGTEQVAVLRKDDVAIGVKADTGLKSIPNSEDELYSDGLTDLDERCQQYKQAGVKFVKWHAVYRISARTPSAMAIELNSQILGRFAAIAQSAGLVPLVEPDVMMDGDHTLATCQHWTEKILSSVYKALCDFGVLLEGTLLKTNMVVAGKACTEKTSVNDVALATVTALRRTVPIAVPGIMFLSGGQTEVQSTLHLNAMNRLPGPRPWLLSFSFARALQDSTMRTWGGNSANFAAAQDVFAKRCKANSLASQGRYVSEAEL